MKIKVERRTNTDLQKLVNGSFKESFDALVIERSGTIILTLEQSGGGDLTYQFSDGLTLLDCTDTGTISGLYEITLTAGSDTAPTENFIYVLQSDKTQLTVSSDWPATEHIKIAYILCPSTAFVSTNGVYINQNWNDHLSGTNNQGHLLHMSERSRRLGAQYFSGIDGNGTTDYLTITTNGGAADNVNFKSTAGLVYQMHRHVVSAVDTSGTDKILVINQHTNNGGAFDDITDLNVLLNDANDAPMSGKYFNLTFIGVANKTGEFSPFMVNLPTGSYNKESDATNDVSGFTVTSVPNAFNKESSTAFEVAIVTLRHQPASGGTWTHIKTKDLRGLSFAGAGAGVSAMDEEFADNLFRVFDETDTTKLLAFDVGDLVSSGNTRTLKIPDADGIIALTSNTDGSSDATLQTAFDNGPTIIADADLVFDMAWPARFIIKSDGDEIFNFDTDLLSITINQLHKAFTPLIIKASNVGLLGTANLTEWHDINDAIIAAVTREGLWTGGVSVTFDEVYSSESGTHTITVDDGAILYELGNSTFMRYNLDGDASFPTKFIIAGQTTGEGGGPGADIMFQVVGASTQRSDTISSVTWLPFVDNVSDLGKASVRWRDLYLAGTIKGATEGAEEIIIEGSTGNVTSLGIIKGALDGDSNKIINVTDPTDDQDAATKKYVVDNYVNVDGSVTLTGNWDAGAFDITVNQIGLDDTDASHHLFLDAGSNLTANRILSFVTGDAARTITLSGNPTLSDWFDQDVKSGTAPTFTADNLSDGGSNAIVTTTQETNWDNHLADNNQAHTDYLINNGDDSTSGRLTMAGADFGGNYIDFTEMAAPADPAANIARMYCKDDGGDTKLFFRDSAGTETEMGGGGAGGVTDHGDLTGLDDDDHPQYTQANGDSPFTSYIGHDEELNNGNSGAADTISVGGNFQKITITDDTTLTLTSPDDVGIIFLRAFNDGVGGHTITWAAAGLIEWAASTPPVHPTAANAQSLYMFYYRGNDSWVGSVIADTG